MREARAGDRYLLCSDGLSDPVSDETIHEALQIPDVAESAYRLIELALRGGGPDNVTVVVADVVDYDYGQTQPILAGAVSGDDDQLTTLPNTSAGRASAIRPREEVAKRVPPQEEAASRPRWSRRRMFIVVTLVVLLVLAGLAIGRAIIRSNYYVAEYNGMVSIMRGIQGSLLGMSLHEPYLIGCLNARNELSLISYSQIRRSSRLPPDATAGSAPSRTRAGSGRTAGRDAWTTPIATAGIVGQLPAAALPAAARHLSAGSPSPDDQRDSTATAIHSAPYVFQRHPTSAAPPRPAPPQAAPAAPATTSPATTTQTVTALPPPPPQPGIDCRAAGMTTQLQPPVAVTPPLPTRRNAELLLLCFAAADHRRRVAHRRGQPGARPALEPGQLRAGLPGRVRRRAPGHPALRPLHRPAAAANCGAAQRTWPGDDPPARPRQQRAERPSSPQRHPADCCGPWSGSPRSRSWSPS